MLYLRLYWKTQEEEMGTAQHITALKPMKVLPTKHFELPDALRHSLHRASDLIRKRRAELREEPLPTSLTGLDHLLGGGLPRGEVVELVGRGSCGRFATLLATLRAVTGAGEAAALVDQGAQLDPQVQPIRQGFQVSAWDAPPGTSPYSRFQTWVSCPA